MNERIFFYSTSKWLPAAALQECFTLESGALFCSSFFPNTGCHIESMEANENLQSSTKLLH